MVHVELNDDERVMMKEILESYLSELTSEIASTETFTFRQPLKRKKAFIMDVLERMSRAA